MLEWGRWVRANSSEFMGVEVRCAIDRLRLDYALDAEGFADAHQALAATERALGPIRLTPLVLRRTGQLPRATVKTPDAIHLASALLLADGVETDLLFATHDRSQAIRVRALEFGVVRRPSGFDAPRCSTTRASRARPAGLFSPETEIPQVRARSPNPPGCSHVRAPADTRIRGPKCFSAPIDKALRDG